MRDAVLTVSPNRQKRGILEPTTPLVTGPLCMPTRISVGPPVGMVTLRASRSIAWRDTRGGGRHSQQPDREESGNDGSLRAACRSAPGVQLYGNRCWVVSCHHCSLPAASSLPLARPTHVPALHAPHSGTGMLFR